MRIVTLNLNGIRSAVNKGFLGWLSQQNADIVGVQELKAQDKDLTHAMRNPDGFHGYFHCADRPGYSGVGIYCRKKPEGVISGIGIADIDAEAWAKNVGWRIDYQGRDSGHRRESHSCGHLRDERF